MRHISGEKQQLVLLLVLKAALQICEGDMFHKHSVQIQQNMEKETKKKENF